MNPLPVFYLVCIVAIKESVCTISLFSFDLSSPDGAHTDFTKQTYSGITHRQYIVKEGFAISSVSEKGVELWKEAKGTDGKCVAVNLYSRGHASFMALWVINGGLTIKRFEKVGGKWKKIELDDFNRKLNGVVGDPSGFHDIADSLRDVQEQTSDADLLDIARPDGSRVDSGNTEENGPVHKTFAPKSGFKFWKSSTDGRCTKSGEEAVKVEHDSVDPSTLTGVYNVDISNPDNSKFVFVDCSVGNVVIKQVFPRSTALGEIIDGKRKVFDIAGSLLCLVHYKGDEPAKTRTIGLNAFENPVSVTMEKMASGKWVSSGAKYGELPDGTALDSESTHPFSIDISKKEGQNWKSVDSTFNGIPTRFIAVKYGYNANEIKFGDTLIYKIKDKDYNEKKERILSVRVHPIDKPTLLHVIRINAEGKLKVRYHTINKKGQWYEALQAYSYRIDKMKERLSAGTK
ncbi:hypothetical protein BEWA_049830 [Theileria equi strain WA]|uniref:Signal peptide containing protein n=1 Tax=Theileria equi strain WA TaxID=1537102 RepID=L1LB12_THEEQ|nr:hypothetical protein BEWA_049830 [Theileria equi strain WA]EKX72516.1 hypothetical protein BEWA_049830 [Theileria equi strain WA]|eukprot:XP_004831968.1 hypothetical protein BEWA_049830 [Theileria equi strain WA]